MSEPTTSNAGVSKPDLRNKVAWGSNLWKSYEKGAIRVLQGATLHLHAGETVALWGASGSGKSTLLHLLGGLDVPDSGELQVAGLNPADERHRLTLRRQHVGFVFQLHNLIADLSALENVLIPTIATGLSQGEGKAHAQELLAQVGLGDKLHRRIQNLSGGERQRVAICRALIHRPQVVLADEPTGALDERTGEQVFGIMQELSRQTGTGILLATHERRFANACDRVYRVKEGTCLPL